MEPQRKIKLKPESIRKNMNVKILLKDNKYIDGFFKKFMYKTTDVKESKSQGQYRDSIEDI